MNQLTVVLLAAGMGTRMKSKRQKILHEVGGKPMVQHVFDAAVSASDSKPVLVVGQGGQGVRELFGESADCRPLHRTRHQNDRLLTTG